MLLYGGVNGIPSLERSKRYELKFLSTHGSKSLTPYTFNENQRIKFECRDDQTNSITDEVEYFVRSISKDDIVSPNVEKHSDIDG